MDLIFERAGCCDADIIFEQCRALVDQYEDPTQVDISRALRWCRRKIETHIEEYTRVCCHGETVGYFRLSSEDGEMELDDFYVLPPFRGRGIGSAILARCCRETDRPMFLCVFKHNTGAIALYTRYGFTIAEAIGTTRLMMRREAV